MNTRKFIGHIEIALLFTALFVIASIAPVSAKADTLYQKTEEGYTEDGIYFEVYKVADPEDIYIESNSVSVTRQILYYAVITPSMEIEWTETISGVSYTGTLKLLNFRVDSNAETTRAVYSGTLYATS